MLSKFIPAIVIKSWKLQTDSEQFHPFRPILLTPNSFYVRIFKNIFFFPFSFHFSSPQSRNNNFRSDLKIFWSTVFHICEINSKSINIGFWEMLFVFCIVYPLQISSWPQARYLFLPINIEQSKHWTCNIYQAWISKYWFSIFWVFKCTLIMCFGENIF